MKMKHLKEASFRKWSRYCPTNFKKIRLLKKIKDTFCWEWGEQTGRL